MDEMRITAREAAAKPNYRKTAAELLARCREFYRDPENEREFREWKAGKKKQGEDE